MKVLVTGGAGFIGSHIVDRLLAKGYDVVIVDDLSTGLMENVNPAAKFVQMDIVKDNLTGLFAAERFDYVIHQAAQTMVPKSLEVPDYDCSVNVLGTVNIMEASRKTGVKRVVFASSAAVYGDVSSVPVNEDASTQPTSFYGLSKLVVENYLKLYNKLFGIEYIILRYANVYGERQGDAGEGGVISIFARKFHKGEALSIFGDGSQTRDFIYAGDVAEANCQAIVAPCANAVYNISTCVETSVNELVELMTKVAGKQVETIYLPARDADIYKSSLNNRAALRNLDWRPQVDLFDGLAATYRFLGR